MSWRAHHRESERLAWDADIAKAAGNDALARSLYSRAAEEERNALADLDPAKRRTFGITTVGIASLYFQGGLYDEAERAAYEFITSDLNSEYGRRELRLLLASIYALREYEPVYADEEPGQISVSLRGGEIEHGKAPARLVGQMIKTLESFLYRTAEFLENRPFRPTGQEPRELREKYTPWVRQLAPGSFRFAVGLHTPDQLPMPSEDLLTPNAVGESMLGIMSAATEDTAGSLAQLVPSIQYRLKFLRLTRDLSPAKNSAFNHLSLRGRGEQHSLTLSHKSRDDLNQHIRAMGLATQTFDEITTEVRGVLRGVDVEQGWLKVAEKYGTQVVHEAGDVIDDVIGSMMNQQVVVVANQNRQGWLRFIDIQPED